MLELNTTRRGCFSNPRCAIASQKVVKAHNGSNGRLPDWLDCWAHCQVPWRGGGIVHYCERCSAARPSCCLHRGASNASIAIQWARHADADDCPPLPPCHEDRRTPARPLQLCPRGGRHLSSFYSQFFFIKKYTHNVLTA